MVLLVEKSSMNKKHYPADRWGKNWSGRGTAMINQIEDRASAVIWPDKFKAPLVLEQLKKLFLKEPKNDFYLSLYKQSKIKPLTQKQIDCITTDYKLKLNRQLF